MGREKGGNKIKIREMLRLCRGKSIAPFSLWAYFPSISLGKYEGVVKSLGGACLTYTK